MVELFEAKHCKIRSFHLSKYLVLDKQMSLQLLNSIKDCTFDSYLGQGDQIKILTLERRGPSKSFDITSTPQSLRVPK
jgi:hypothetical protein